MATLQDVTLAHSRRLSEIHRTRDAELGAATLQRDLSLRGLPSAAAIFRRFDDAVADARAGRAATEQRAAAARDAVLRRAIAERTGGLDAAEGARRAADLAALAAKQQADAAAEERHRRALSALTPAMPLDARLGRVRDADEARAAELEKAERAFRAAISASQDAHQASVDLAIARERDLSGDADRSLVDALRLADVALSTSIAAAQRDLDQGLAALGEAREALQAHQQRAASISATAREREEREFAQFRHELAQAT